MDRSRAFLHKHPYLKMMTEPALAARRWLLGRRQARANEILTRVRELIAEDVVIRVPEFSGNFSINPSSDLFSRLLVNKEYEPTLVKLALASINPTRDAIDIGANVGFFSVAMAQRMNGGRILSVEPSSATADRLERNIARNGVGAATIVFRGAVADQAGMLALNYVQGKEEYSSLGVLVHPSIAQNAKTSESVVVKKVDDLVSEYKLDPAFLKIDVEGAEHLVLAGAKETLRRNRPVILSELSNPLLVSNGSSSSQVIKFLMDQGYTVKDALFPDLRPGVREFCDIICYPSD